jgi:hypothetical protein
MISNTGVWSPDGRWIVYDIRREDGVFDGTRIERVHVETGETQVLYESRRGACCGVATYHPIEDKVIFIHGPENPVPGWSYSAYHRQGVMVDASHPGVAMNLDACDLTLPLTPGALRGGSHVHVFSADGQWVSFTYEDHLLAENRRETADSHVNLRNVGVSVPLGPVIVDRGHPRNHDGLHFSVLATRTTAHPKPGSDEIAKACEEGWVGVKGYRKADGSRQKRALAFQGNVLAPNGSSLAEVFIVDLPDDVTVPGEGPLAGTEKLRPFPPKGTVQRRLTFTSGRKHPGIQGPRHWLRCAPDGSRIAFLMKDDGGLAQIWTISPLGGDPVQMTRLEWPLASSFTWSPDGRRIAFVADNSVFAVDAQTGVSSRLTDRSPDASAPGPFACVFSPDGQRIAYLRPIAQEQGLFRQIFCCSI